MAKKWKKLSSPPPGSPPPPAPEAPVLPPEEVPEPSAKESCRRIYERLRSLPADDRGMKDGTYDLLEAFAFQHSQRSFPGLALKYLSGRSPALAAEALLCEMREMKWLD